jgi:hypothetical protein
MLNYSNNNNIFEKLETRVKVHGEGSIQNGLFKERLPCMVLNEEHPH